MSWRAALAAISSAFLLASCGSHWIQGQSGPPRSVAAITQRLGPRDLRVALKRCAEEDEPAYLQRLDNVDDDRLKSSFVRGSLEFNKCMSAQGWITFPDMMLAP